MIKDIESSSEHESIIIRIINTSDPTRNIKYNDFRREKSVIPKTTMNNIIYVDRKHHITAGNKKHILHDITKKNSDKQERLVHKNEYNENNIKTAIKTMNQLRTFFFMNQIRIVV